MGNDKTFVIRDMEAADCTSIIEPLVASDATFSVSDASCECFFLIFSFSFSFSLFFLSFQPLTNHPHWKWKAPGPRSRLSFLKIRKKKKENKFKKKLVRLISILFNLNLFIYFISSFFCSAWCNYPQLERIPAHRNFNAGTPHGGRWQGKCDSRPTRCFDHFQWRKPWNHWWWIRKRWSV